MAGCQMQLANLNCILMWLLLGNNVLITWCVGVDFVGVCKWFVLMENGDASLKLTMNLWQQSWASKNKKKTNGYIYRLSIGKLQSARQSNFDRTITFYV
jgi:hypothetical protein